MLGDMTAFASLIFGVFFYWTASDAFPPPLADHANGALVLVSAVLFGAAWGATRVARPLHRAGRVPLAQALLAGGAVAGLGGAGAMVLSVLHLDPTAHVYPAILYAIAVWTAVHTIPGVIMQLYCLAGTIFGKVLPTYDAPIWNTVLYWHFLLVTALVSAFVIGALPGMM